MEYLQVGLLVVIAGLLIALVRRLGEMRTDVRVLDAREQLEQLPDSFRRLEERLESLRPPPAPEKPPTPEAPPPLNVQVEIADDLHEAVRGAVQEMERDVKKMLRIAGRGRAERIGARIEKRLLNMGYKNIQITGGLPRTRSPKALTRVPVDAERDGHPHRGVVVLRGNEVEEVRLSSLTRMFP